MANFNRTILAGNLTRDVELKFTQGGMAIASISIAVNDRRKRGEEWVDEPSFFDCTLFGKTAEICSEYCSKGSNILVEGKLKQESWEKDGQKRSKVVVLVDSLQFLGTRGSKFQDGQQQSHQSTPSQATSRTPAMVGADDDVPF